MRMNASQEMFGYPVLEIRRLMRASAADSWGVSFVAAALRIENNPAAELVKAMLADGLIAETDLEANGQTYELTTKGMALGMARAAKPIKRATAERLVSEFLQRVEQVNNDPDLLFWVNEVVVFGSCLTNSPTLGDVDLAVMYARRIGPALWTAGSRQRVAIARANGRYFSGIIERIAWPQREIELRLRKGLGALHIHDLSMEGKFIETLSHRRIYVRQPEVSPAGLGIMTTSPAGSLNSPGNLA